MKRTLVSVLLLIGCVLSANADPLSQEQLEAIAIQPASNWGNTGDNVVPEMLPLFKEETIDINGTTRKFRLHVPENLEDGRKYPMILWLHGAGEAGSDNKLQLVHLHHIITQLTGEKKRDFFLLVPQYGRSEHWCGTGGGTFSTIAHVPPDVKNGKKTLEAYKKELIEQTKAASEPGAQVTIEERTETIERTKPGMFGFGRVTEAVEEKFLFVTVKNAKKSGPLEAAFAMIEKVLEDYPVDADRITVSGLSSGGDGTWETVQRRPDLFAAAVPLVSWQSFSEANLEKSPLLKKIPIWAIYSSDDNSIDHARASFERVEKAGCNVKKTEFGICGHSAWTPAMLQADIFNWLLSRSKKDGEYTQVFDPGVNPDDLKGIVDVATRDPGKPTLAPAVPATVSGADAAMRERLEQSRVHVFAEAQTPQPAATRLETCEVEIIERVMGADGKITEQVKHVQAVVPVITSQPLLVTYQQIMPMPCPERDAAYAALAEGYFDMALIGQEREKALEKFVQCSQKISPSARAKLVINLAHVTPDCRSVEVLAVLEKVLDDSASPVILPDPLYTPLAAGQEAGTLCAAVEKIIEECNRPWAMTSGSLYGMFPADWDKEAEAIPDFVVNLSSDDLAHKLAKSVGEDPEAADFLAACKSIMSLQNKPMSSPWFETSGGRLRSEIQYTLSAKGEMFVRFLKAVKDSGGTEKSQALSKAAQKTLEKIDMVLAKE